MIHPEQLLIKIKERLEALGLNDQILLSNLAELEEVLMFYYHVIMKCPVAIDLSDAEQRKLIWTNVRAVEVLGKDWSEMIGEGKPHQLMNASFDLSEALQDRLNFYKSIKGVAQENHHIPANQLTSREKEILRLIAHGFTMREVAEKLKISHHTAGTHRKNLFKKTKINKTSDLIRFAMKNGLD